MLNIVSADQFYNSYEALIKKAYCYGAANQRKDIVLVVGMNIDNSVLFFLQNENIEKVYGYEPFERTFRLAQINLERNMELLMSYMRQRC